MNGLYKTVLDGEARIGAKVFEDSGGKNRRFYCQDENTWVWHQGSATVFYKINPASVYKSNDGISWRVAGEDEVKRLLKAAKLYKRLVEVKVHGSLLSLR